MVQKLDLSLDPLSTWSVAKVEAESEGRQDRARPGEEKARWHGPFEAPQALWMRADRSENLVVLRAVSGCHVAAADSLAQNRGLAHSKLVGLVGDAGHRPAHQAGNLQVVHVGVQQPQALDLRR